MDIEPQQGWGGPSIEAVTAALISLTRRVLDLEAWRYEVSPEVMQEELRQIAQQRAEHDQPVGSDA
jgi:hypothetical protein